MNEDYQQRLRFNEHANLPTEREIGCLPFFARVKAKETYYKRFREFVEAEKLESMRRSEVRDFDELYDQEEFH